MTTSKDAETAANADTVIFSFAIIEAKGITPAIIDALKFKLVSVSCVCLIAIIKSHFERLTFFPRLTDRTVA